MILYLHGFRSSPRSNKASLMRSTLEGRGRAGDFVCPQLPISPRGAANVVLAAAALEDPARLAVVGSSLGGYYATWLAEQLGCRAVLLNPVIHPWRDLAAHLGHQTVFFSDQSIELTQDHLTQLQGLDTAHLTRPERYFLVAATGDEVIDCNTMLAKYSACRQRVIEGSDHALSDFGRYLDEVLDFCDGLT
jgi:predicted esterase YcpF (UPF0227 family)